MLSFAAIAPHPPIIIPEIGSKENLKTASQTIKAMKKLAGELETCNPETIIIISPHAQLLPNAFLLNCADIISGNLSDFGIEAKYEFQNDQDLLGEITTSLQQNNIPYQLVSCPLDHGSIVPLHYLAQNIKPKIIQLSFSFLDLKSHYSYGQVLGNVCRNQNKKIAIIASGDLSHRLSLDSPAGFSPAGARFDKELIVFLKKDQPNKLISLDPDFIEEAGECGLRSFMILLGAIRGTSYDFELYSYEGPFGVGYMVARFI